jgi:hypothetical protein
MPLLLLVIGAAIAFIAGGLATRWVVEHQPVVADLPAGSNAIPQEAIITLSFSTDPNQWRQLRQFGTPETQEIVDERLAQLRDRFLATYGYSYQQDIQPWVGKEITVALLSKTPTLPNDTATPSPQSSANQQQSLVVVLPIADGAQAQNILSKPSTNPSQSWATREYQGIQIHEAQTAQEPLAMAMLGNNLLAAATDAKALEQVIDTYRGKDSVATAPGYRQAIGQVAVAQPFLRTYINAPAARTLVTADTIQPVPTPSFGPLQQNQGLAASVSLNPDGVQLRGIGWLPNNSQRRYEVKNAASQVPTWLPDNTGLMVSGGNLKTFWTDYSQQPDGIDPKSLANPANFRQAIQSTTGLDLDQDLISWMNGEFCLALLPVGGQSNSKPFQGIAFMVKASDRTAAETALKRLDTTMSDRYRFRISEDNTGNQPTVKWVSPFAALTVTRGWLDDDIAFLTVGAPGGNPIAPKPNSPLTQNETFQQATATDLKANNGQFFLNLNRFTDPNSSLPLPKLPPAVDSFTKAIRAIGVTAAIRDATSSRFDIQVLLKKAANPRPLPSVTSEPQPSPSP